MQKYYIFILLLILSACGLKKPLIYREDVADAQVQIER